LPTQDRILAPPTHDTELEGTVVDFSDSGVARRVFAVVNVVRTQTVVVPVEKLRVIPFETGGGT